MNLTAFLTKRRPEWRQLEEVLRRVEGSGLGSLDEDQAIEFGQLYRRAASDLNQAQTFVSGDATVQYLNDLVARCYLVIYAKPTGRSPWALIVPFSDRTPCANYSSPATGRCSRPAPVPRSWRKPWSGMSALRRACMSRCARRFRI